MEHVEIAPIPLDAPRLVLEFLRLALEQEEWWEHADAARARIQEVALKAAEGILVGSPTWRMASASHDEVMSALVMSLALQPTNLTAERMANALTLFVTKAREVKGLAN